MVSCTHLTLWFTWLLLVVNDSVAFDWWFLVVRTNGVCFTKQRKTQFDIWREKVVEENKVPINRNGTYFSDSIQSYLKDVSGKTYHTHTINNENCQYCQNCHHITKLCLLACIWLYIRCSFVLADIKKSLQIKKKNKKK